MKNQIFLWSSRLIVCAAILLATISCIKNRMPWYLDTVQLMKEYRAAVDDARTAELDEVCDTLPAIKYDNSCIEWLDEEGYTSILVGTMMSEADANVFRECEGTSPMLWVTLPYDLENHVRRASICTDSMECRMRLVQMLGLPPDCNYDRMVFFYVDSNKLLRPSPDPEIDDRKASLYFTKDLPEHYKKWFAENMTFSYESKTPYPWTRLGYTYDWNDEAESVVGPGEFIVHPGARVRFKREVTAWSWYQETVKERGLRGIHQ